MTYRHNWSCINPAWTVRLRSYIFSRPVINPTPGNSPVHEAKILNLATLILIFRVETRDVVRVRLISQGGHQIPITMRQSAVVRLVPAIRRLEVEQYHLAVV